MVRNAGKSENLGCGQSINRKNVAAVDRKLVDVGGASEELVDESRLQVETTMKTETSPLRGTL